MGGRKCTVKKCGSEIEDNAVYCPECGVKLRDNEELPEAPYSYEPEESGINEPLWEPEEAKTGIEAEVACRRASGSGRCGCSRNPVLENPEAL